MSQLPVHPSNDVGVAAWSALLRTHAAVVRAIERDVERATGLPLSWYDVLLELSAAPDRRLRMQQVAERVVLSRTRVSRVVDEMVAAGFVAKRPDADDGRATLAVMTAAGRAALRKAAPVYLDRIRLQFARHLDEQQLSTLRDALEQVLAAHADHR